MEILVFVILLILGSVVLGVLAHHEIYIKDITKSIEQVKYMFRHRLFLIRETPIVLGILIVFLTWGSKNLVDRVTSTPYVEYQIKSMASDQYSAWVKKYKTAVIDCLSKKPIKANGMHFLEITLTNLTDTKLLSDVSLAFGYPPNSGVDIKGIQLLSKAPTLKPDDAEKCGKSFAEVKKLTFHPKAEYILMLAVTGDKEPYAVLVNSEVATIFKKSSLATWLVKNELQILLALLISGALLAVLYLVSIASSSDESKKGV